ncbi:hypothetical protein BT63DRAFT_440194 [Microthyrium microscopicum]|uniref:Uncharacterized protein n=1 Tax=Microthyrium microscopicum TaxID=703497 RepID=A0A6A6UBD9_9PEZI|nr:hypothetical protein BT63DRAFT_440194 [Microthyrium microscopicum]
MVSTIYLLTATFAMLAAATPVAENHQLVARQARTGWCADAHTRGINAGVTKKCCEQVKGNRAGDQCTAQNTHTQAAFTGCCFQNGKLDTRGIIVGKHSSECIIFAPEPG